jgi:hypothetical protein
MPACLQLVQGQFPQVQERVAILFEVDDVFRELCEDYEACTLALSRKPSSEGFLREYEALRLRLETELLRYLDESGDPSRGRR